MHRVLVTLLAAIASLSLWNTVQANPRPAPPPWFGGEFSADIEMVNPQTGAKGTGKLFVGKFVLRAEGVYQRQPMAVLIDTMNRKAYTLLLDKKQYHKGLGNAPLPPKPDVDVLPTDPDSPCKTQQNVSCHRMRVVALPDGTQAEKWEVRTTQQNQHVTLSLLVDPARRLILQHQLKGGKGPAMERVMTGTEEINGRHVEKWQFVQQIPGSVIKFTQWVDPKLRVPVRVQGSEKSFQAELTNIQEGPQPPELFQIPPDFQEVQPPQRQRSKIPPPQYQ
jgi:hypothetical protein